MPMLDLYEPMMIEGMPDSQIRDVQINLDGRYEGVVVIPNRAFTHITFRQNGWMTSTTYHSNRVINRSVHDEAVRVAEANSAAVMEANNLWGLF